MEGGWQPWETVPVDGSEFEGLYDDPKRPTIVPRCRIHEDYLQSFEEGKWDFVQYHLSAWRPPRPTESDQ